MHQHVCVGVCERTRVTDRSFSVCLLCDSAVLSMTCKLHLSIDVGTTLQLSNQSSMSATSINVCMGKNRLLAIASESIKFND